MDAHASLIDPCHIWHLLIAFQYVVLIDADTSIHRYEGDCVTPLGRFVAALLVLRLARKAASRFFVTGN